jgi:hypothetical protein
MKPQIATTPEQSQRLLSCGVSTDTADMYYTNYPNKPNDNKPYIGMVGIRKDLIPAWSLSRLLELMPHVIEVDDDTDCYFCLAKDYPASEDYSAAYLECWTFDHESIVRIRDNSPIEACVQLIEWLSANGYKLNEDKE